jgi:hypothetical protein
VTAPDRPHRFCGTTSYEPPKNCVPKKLKQAGPSQLPPPGFGKMATLMMPVLLPALSVLLPTSTKLNAPELLPELSLSLPMNAMLLATLNAPTTRLLPVPWLSSPMSTMLLPKLNALATRLLPNQPPVSGTFAVYGPTGALRDQTPKFRKDNLYEKWGVNRIGVIGDQHLYRLRDHQAAVDIMVAFVADSSSREHEIEADKNAPR